MDGSTKAVVSVLKQFQEGIDKPCIFVSQASKRGNMELGLYAFVFHVNHLSPYLLGKQFIV